MPHRRAGALRHHARHRIGGEVVAKLRYRRLHQGCFDMLPLRLALSAREQRGASAGEGQHASAHVDDGGTEARGCAVAVAGHGHHAGKGLQHVVVSRPIGKGPERAVASDRNMHQVFIERREPWPRQAQAFGGCRRKVLNEHISLLHQPSENLLPAFALEIESDAALAAVDRPEVGTAAIDNRQPTAVLVTLSVFDLDDLCTHVSEKLPARGAGEHAAYVKHPDACEGGHLRFLQRMTRLRRGLVLALFAWETIAGLLST